MKFDLFRKISKTVTYKGSFKFLREGKVIIKPIFWTNTNKLLEKSNIIGVKTGITGKAGGCLATAFKIDKEEGYIIVLGSNSTDNRFKSASRTGNESFGNPHVGNITSKPRYPGTVPGSTSGGMKWRFHWCACAR